MTEHPGATVTEISEHRGGTVVELTPAAHAATGPALFAVTVAATVDGRTVRRVHRVRAARADTATAALADPIGADAVGITVESVRALT